jgi:GT2 family glycosyltransferase
MYDKDGVTVSIVSHGQGAVAQQLLNDLYRLTNVSCVILTQNIPEACPTLPLSRRPQVRLIKNASPLGFGVNHNRAFSFCETRFFAVLNPDVRLIEDPFHILSQALVFVGGSIIAPTVKNSDGVCENNTRRFPTPLRVASKIFSIRDDRLRPEGFNPQAVDWAAGMFLVFASSVYGEVGGFDEGYFLYYEDVDICTRVWRSGGRVLLHPGVTVIHDAQRASHKSLRYLRWHVSSMLRYFAKNWGRLPR